MTNAARNTGTTLATGASIKPLKGGKPNKAAIEHAALIEKGSALIADAAWSAGSGEFNLTGRIKESLSLPVVDSVAVLAGAFSLLNAKAKADPIPVGASAEVRIAMERDADAKVEQWWKSGNSIASICRQARDKMPLDARPVVSIKLDKSGCEAVVTIVPAGASRDDVAKALDHDKKALAQVVKKLDREDAERAEVAAKAKGLPSPKAEKLAREQAEREEKETADLMRGMVTTTTGKPLADLPLIVIAASLAGAPSAYLTELAKLLTAQAGRNAKAEAKAAEKAQKDADAKAAKELAAKSGKGTGANAKAAGKGGKGAPVTPAAPASAGNAKVAAKSADGVTKDVGKASGADNLTDSVITTKPSVSTPDANASA